MSLCCYYYYYHYCYGRRMRVRKAHTKGAEYPFSETAGWWVVCIYNDGDNSGHGIVLVLVQCVRRGMKSKRGGFRCTLCG